MIRIEQIGRTVGGLDALLNADRLMVDRLQAAKFEIGFPMLDALGTERRLRERVSELGRVELELLAIAERLAHLYVQVIVVVVSVEGIVEEHPVRHFVVVVDLDGLDPAAVCAGHVGDRVPEAEALRVQVEAGGNRSGLKEVKRKKFGGN